MHRFVFASFIVFAAGCGGGSSSVPPDQLGTELGEVMCARMAECCTTEEFMEQTLGADSEEECRALYTGLVGGLLVPVLEDSIAAGRVVYHADRMGACLDTMAAMSCGEAVVAMGGDTLWGGCEDPFEGQVAVDGVCASDWDCVSEYCSGDSVDFDGNITYGVCAEPPTVGMPCDDFDCAPGAYCDSGAGTPTCQALLADGSACGNEDECASGGCEGGRCGPPTVCDGND